MAENLDQATIDQIVATAEEDTPESKIAKLEKEIETLKGSIKRLLLDIRETMNNLENPFQSLQNLAEVISKPIQPQPVQVIPTPPLEPERKEEKKEEEKKEEKEEKMEEVKKEEVEVKEKEEVKATSKSEVESEVVGGVKSEIKSEKEVVEEEKSGLMEVGLEKVEKKERVQPMGVLAKLDIITLYNLMEWIRCMLEKYDSTTLKNLIEIFESAGYISSELKDFVIKMIDVISVMGVSNGLEELIIDLYKLHKIMNPEDTSMDSKLLSLLLEKKLASEILR